MSAKKKSPVASPQVPTIKELIDVVNNYNMAREQELRMMPAGGFPKEYKNDLMDALYDCAAAAAKQLRPVLEANLEIGERS